jgi:hypothetical protein
MAHFAKLNSNNIIEEVVIIDNAILDDGSDTENEQQGIDFCISLWGDGTYVQTSYNGNFRQEYATIGGTFDTTDNGFIKPSPFPSWTFNKTNWQWEAPVAEPSDADTVPYLWNETLQRWDNANTTTS